MRFNDNDRKQLLVQNLNTTQDPTTGTLAVTIDGTDYPCTWDGPATQKAGGWTRPAHTNAYFAGPRVATGDLAGAVVLGYGLHVAEVKLTIAGTIVACDVESISVRDD